MDDATKAPELLPCPFCGGKAVLDRAMLTGAFRVVCENCGVSTPWLGQVMDCPTPQQERISTAWNRRATPEALGKPPEVAALLAAAILDAQLRCMERGRIDTPDEIRTAAALRGEKEPK